MRNLLSIFETLRLRLWILAGATALSGCSEAAENARYTHTAIVKTEQIDRNQWQLLRNGEPYKIYGGGGQEQIVLLARLGGNRVTFGVKGVHRFPQLLRVQGTLVHGSCGSREERRECSKSSGLTF